MMETATPLRPAIVFDFDGTLADSIEVVAAAYNEVAPRLRILPVTHDTLLRLRHMSPRDALRAQGVSFWKLPLLVRMVRRALRTRTAELAPFDGVVPALRALAARGAHCSILSTNAGENITQFLERHELAMFEHIAGSVSMFGKARALKRLLRRAQLDPSTTYYVGDEVRDMAAAAAAGMKSVAVSWGYADRAALAATNPHLLLDRPEQLVELLLGARG